MPTVLIGGGSGLVGSRLSRLLREKGHDVRHLSRSKNLEAEFPAYAWDIEKGTIDEDALRQADYLINLAGAGIADKLWTGQRKKVLTDSRVDSTNLLYEYLQRGVGQPKAFLSASAIGYYGDQGDRWLQEDTPPAPDGFMTELCSQWEAAAAQVETLGIRTLRFRIGLVLSTKGGALPSLIMPMMLRVGGYFGSGKQWYPWIHIDDLCRIFMYALENDLPSGPYNTVAPNPVTCKDFIKKIAEARDMSVLTMPVPAFGLRLILGEMANTVLHSYRVASGKISQAGFEFEHPELVPALQDLFAREI